MKNPLFRRSIISTLALQEGLAESFVESSSESSTEVSSEASSPGWRERANRRSNQRRNQRRRPGSGYNSTALPLSDYRQIPLSARPGASIFR